jgi:hypothetical protein
MKIIKQTNPLHTLVDLNDDDKATLHDLLTGEHLENLKYELGVRVSARPSYGFHNVAPDVEQIINELLPSKEDITEESLIYQEELTSPHSGDCTNKLFACGKCYVEGLLGISTISELNKIVAGRIEDAFAYTFGNRNEALEYLRQQKHHHESFVNVGKHLEEVRDASIAYDTLLTWKADHDTH